MNTSQSQQLLHTFFYDPNIYMYLLVILEGNLTTDDILKAVEDAYSQNETTMSRLVLEEGKLWFRTMDRTGCKAMVDVRDWRQIMKEDEGDVLRIDEGEFFRTYVIKKENHYELFIRAHHIAADGKSLVILLNDICDSLEGVRVNYKPLNNLGAERIPANQKPLFPVYLLIQYMNRIWKKKGQPFFTWKEYYAVHKKFWNTSESEVILEEVGEEEVSRIRAACKEHKITVNSYILAKLFKENPEYQHICFPISLRNENRSISNKAFMVRTRYRYNQKKSFWENAERLHRAARKLIENRKNRYELSLRVRCMEPSLLDSALLYTHLGYDNPISKLLAELIGYSGKRKTDLVVTNLTNLDISCKYTRFQVKKPIVIAPTMSAGRNVVCIASFRNEMMITRTRIIAKG